jgi:predicted nucleotidyltransferase/DNA-binding XRE family transcriptional regulator
VFAPVYRGFARGLSAGSNLLTINQMGAARRGKTPTLCSSAKHDRIRRVDAGLLLREARLRAGLSQSELARRVGVTQSVVSEYEAGKREPALPTLAKLIAGTGHDLTVGLQPSDPIVKGLPDSPLGRRLRRHRRALIAAVDRAGGSNLRVFGSVARGEDSPDSDVDLLVDLPDGTGLFALLGLEGELERLLKVRVDLATPSSLKPRVRAEALAEAIAL